MISMVDSLLSSDKIKKIHTKASSIASEIPWDEIMIAFAPAVAEIAANVVVNVSCACVARLGCASTGTPINTLNGAAKSKSILARFGGGSLATNGMGIDGGKSILNCLHFSTKTAVSTVAYRYKATYDYKKS